MVQRSDLAVLQVGVDVLDEGIIWVPDGENQLAERAASHVTLLCLHPELQHMQTPHESLKKPESGLHALCN